VTLNKLQYEMDFHAEANSRQNEKFNLASANKVSIACTKYRGPFFDTP